MEIELRRRRLRIGRHFQPGRRRRARHLQHVDHAGSGDAGVGRVDAEALKLRRPLDAGEHLGQPGNSHEAFVGASAEQAHQRQRNVAADRQGRGSLVAGVRLRLLRPSVAPPSGSVPRKVRRCFSPIGVRRNTITLPCSSRDQRPTRPPESSPTSATSTESIVISGGVCNSWW